MLEFKGTKGPWSAVSNEYYYEICPKNNAQSFISAHVNPYLGINKDEMCANAHLIAAAPDLLDLALKYKADLINIVPQSPARDNRLLEVQTIINNALDIKEEVSC